MKSFCILFLAALLQLSNAVPVEQASLPANPFIINGEEAKVGEFPHHLALEWKIGSKWIYGCGAVLLNEHQALTAITCLFGARELSDLRVVAGLHDRKDTNHSQAVLIRKVVMHPGHPELYRFDIAMLTFETPLNLTSNVQPIAWNSDDDVTFEGERCVLSGWGRTETSVNSALLRKVSVNIISNNECKNHTPRGGFIYRGNICAYEPKYAACRADNGGPMTCQKDGRPILAGIGSWGIFPVGSLCNPDHASVYTRVSHFRLFIFTNLIKP